MAPAIAPKQYGTMTDEMANAAPKLRRSRVRKTALRKAKLEPRSTMPNAAIDSGTNRVSVIEAYASEKPVHSTTKQKISQTWLASHTGPIEWSITSRGRSPRSAPPATRSQNPAPKSAPPKTAYAVTAANSTTATVVLMEPTPPRRGVQPVSARAVRHVVVVTDARVAEAPAHLAQDQHGRDAESDVQHGRRART